MNQQERQQLVAYRIRPAKGTLSEVELHIQNQLWITAVNRIYYACFYAVSALMVDREIESHTHSGTKQIFGFHFIKTGIISPESGKFFSTIFNLRQTGDYDDFVEFDQNYVTALLMPAADLISQIEKTLINL